MVNEKNNYIRNSYVYDDVKKHFKCNLDEGKCSYVITGEKFHCGNAKSHLIRKHSTEYKKLLATTSSIQAKDIDSLLSCDTNWESIEDNCKIKINSSKKKCINNLVSIFTVGGRPFTLCDDEGFKYFVAPYFECFRITLNKNTVQGFIKNEAKIKRNELSNILHNRVISIKVDLTTINRMNYISINCQFIDNYKIKIFNLLMNELDGSSTAENIKREILCCLELFKIKIEQVFTITIDNGTNVVKASNMLNDEYIEIENHVAENFINSITCPSEEEKNIEDLVQSVGKVGDISTIRCVAHTFQLAINSFFIETQEIIQLVRNLAKELRCPRHKTLLKQHCLATPSIDNATRWSSVFNMLESVVKCKKLVDILGEFDKSLALLDAEWDTIVMLLNVMKICNEMTLFLQKQQLAFSDTYYIYLKTLANLQKMNNDMSKKLITYINKRLKDFFTKEPIVLASLFLDPRFKTLLNIEQKQKAKEVLLKLYVRIEMLTVTENNENGIDTNSFLLIDDSDPVEKMYFKNDKPVVSKNQNQVITQRLCDFVNVERIRSCESVFSYWKNNQTLFKDLNSLACVVMAVPSTQVSVERSFSDLKFICGNLRNRLSRNIVNDIIFLRVISRFG